MSESESVPSGEAANRDALVDRIFHAAIGMMEIASIYLGHRLRYYATLATHPSLTPSELASRTGTSPRYTREWLEHQAVSGILDVVQTADAESRRYSLPPGHAEVLTNADSQAYVTPFALQLIGSVRPIDALLQAYRDGGGVPYSDFGEDMREGIEAGNRVMFINQLGSEWIPALPDVHQRLLADPPANIADVGCGSGWSSIALARAFPNTRVHGIDIDEASIAAARENAANAGLDHRISFHLGDAADPARSGQYDFACAFECIHDMAQPVEALRAMRNLVGNGGTVLIGDERVAETFTAPGDDLERLMYGFSILHCLPVGMVDQPSAETGTVMRSSTLERYAHEAGFRSMEILPVENDLWRFYRLNA